MSGYLRSNMNLCSSSRWWKYVLTMTLRICFRSLEAYLEKRTLVIICGNEVTRSWLMSKASELGLRRRSNKIRPGTNKSIAENYVKYIIGLIEELNPELVLFIDELSAQVLKQKVWMILVGTTRLQIRVLGGPDDNKDPPS
ncbi:hypothetical protein J6590_020761 [Homalodisca vitripennis]|nr:hypothetical protein J6590_020761 [Homalodisca vitripennis]